MLVPLLLLGLAALVLVGYYAGQPLWLAWRRRLIASRPFPAAWRAILRRRVPAYGRLPAPLQQQLRERVLVFLAEKPFIGCAGQPVDDEVRVTIAAQACLLLLNRPAQDYPRLSQVLVYPGPFVVQRVHADGAGVLHDQRRALAGESWQQGQVILSWDDVVEGARCPGTGHNVVLHEFAHQLDQETGRANGAPHLPSRARHERWSRVMSDAFLRLRWQVDAGQAEGTLGAYAATDPAEFFAVATEAFFERPGWLCATSPAVFEELRAYYSVDPREWQAH